MKACSQGKPLLEAYRRNKVTAPEAAALRAHAAECLACAAEVRSVRVEQALLHATLPVEEWLQFSPHFFSRLKARLREEGRAGNTSFWEFVWGFSRSFAVAAMVFVIVVSVLNVYTNRQRPEAAESRGGYLLEFTDSDDISLILQGSEELTPDQVMKTLVAIDGDKNGYER